MNEYERLWNPLDYLNQYYSGARVSPDEVANARFASKVLKSLGRDFDRALEFGCGPTVHHAAAVAPYAKQIDMADYLDSNLDQVRSWKEGRSGGHDWDQYLENVVASEVMADANALSERRRLLRERIGLLLQGDIRSKRPIGSDSVYGLVFSYYCIEAVAADKQQWSEFFRNLCGLVKPGGVLLLGSMLHCTGYKVFDSSFKSAPIDEHDIERELARNGFDPDRAVLEVNANAGWGTQGFSSTCCLLAVKQS
ncbi:guanitoxin biosynthesis pre-guanitoxin forming N-methyltransferase GntF [Roseateles sp. DB2]|uniref:guanitoxin biosynthesis pre-guanitoxin forming N-methyltransferase GntF n=1 Tax=Roseateles sp. DB2 TaxID=3453717 RepID=UPI003EEA0B33